MIANQQDEEQQQQQQQQLTPVEPAANCQNITETNQPTSRVICAACLGSLGLFGNSVLQLIACQLAAEQQGLRLQVTPAYHLHCIHSSICKRAASGASIAADCC